jgi:photosystem I P700 chlorophyll a apoprotein A2
MVFSSLAWTGHLVHVAIPDVVNVRWDNFLTTLPSGTNAFFTGNGLLTLTQTLVHIFSSSQGSGTAILTFLGGSRKHKVYGYQTLLITI